MLKSISACRILLFKVVTFPEVSWMILTCQSNIEKRIRLYNVAHLYIDTAGCTKGVSTSVIMLP